MNILLTGASGFIGRNIATAIDAAGHLVKPVSRSHGIDYSEMLSSENWLPHLEGIDAVINCVGIIGETSGQRFEILHSQAPIALFKACFQAGIQPVLQVSALGADENAFSAYHLTKKAADDYLRDLNLDWFVLKPSLVYGKGGTSSEMFMRLASLPLIPVIGNGQQLLQPVHITDVVAAVMKALTSGKTQLTIDIVGTDTISFSGWLQMMRVAQGLERTRELCIPFKMAKILASFGQYLSPVLKPENLDMLEAGYWADSKPFIEFLGRDPLVIKPNLFFTKVESIRDAS